MKKERENEESSVRNQFKLKKGFSEGRRRKVPVKAFVIKGDGNSFRELLGRTAHGED
jgi:hypothetical protein